MLPRNDRIRHGRPRPSLGISASAVLVAVAAGLAIATACLALDLEIAPPHQSRGYVWTEARLDDVISSRVEESLSRGMPATFQFHTELWRHRSVWFDRLEQSFDASLRVRYEVWSGLYRIEGKGLAPVSVATLDSVRMVLSKPIELPTGRLELLKPGSRYYIVVSVTLKPLSVEDLEEGEGWLTGEVENKRKAGLGIITAIPRSVFDAVRNFAGFGDERSRAISHDFEPEALLPGGEP